MKDKKFEMAARAAEKLARKRKQLLRKLRLQERLQAELVAVEAELIKVCPHTSARIRSSARSAARPSPMTATAIRNAYASTAD